MSTLEVPVVAVEEVKPHPNADRLDLARVGGWWCVVGKGEFTQGSPAVYIPIDSVLPQDLEDTLFPKGSKIVLHDHRVRTERIRGSISQGLLVPLNRLATYYGHLRYTHAGENVADILHITKYEPPEPPPMMRGGTATVQPHPDFVRYTDIEHLQRFPNVLKPDEVVYITEKMHGTSARFGWMPRRPRHWWGRLLVRLGVLSRYEFVVGSRRVEMAPGKVGFYKAIAKHEGLNLYQLVARKYDLAKHLRPGEMLFGEIIGYGVQGEYRYGCGPGEWRLMVYDMANDRRYLPFGQTIAWCRLRGLDTVPVLGVQKMGLIDLEAVVRGRSFVGEQPIREGIVVRPMAERGDPSAGRVIFKYVNPEFLLRQPTEFH